MKQALFLLFTIAALLAACGGAEPAPETAAAVPQGVSDTAVPSTETAAPPPTAIPPTAAAQAAETDLPDIELETASEPAATEAEPPTPTSLPLPTEEVIVEAVAEVTSGRTAEGVYFLGNPNAPVTIIDYSDFL